MKTVTVHKLMDEPTYVQDAFWALRAIAPMLTQREVLAFARALQAGMRGDDSGVGIDDTTLVTARVISHTEEVDPS